jgi:hypothetical protein
MTHVGFERAEFSPGTAGTQPRHERACRRAGAVGGGTLRHSGGDPDQRLMRKRAGSGAVPGRRPPGAE